jgi:hypothetical protein
MIFSNVYIISGLDFVGSDVHVHNGDIYVSANAP